MNEARQQQQDYNSHVSRERKNTQRLLRLRNDNELQLQNEILEKNKIIACLTKKLKDSTKIILSLNTKLSSGAEQQKQQVQKAVGKEVGALQQSHSRVLEDVKAKFENEIENLATKLQQSEDEKASLLVNFKRLEVEQEEQKSQGEKSMHDQTSQLHQIINAKV